MASDVKYIFHICLREAWETAIKQSVYRADSLETQGFIHCSSHEQFERVANTYFRGGKDLVLLIIDPFKVEADIKWELAMDVPGLLFPHIYGALNLDAVIQVMDLTSKPDGSWIIPSG